MKYKFYGADDCKVSAINNDYKGIDDPLVLYDVLSTLWTRDTCAPRMQKDWREDNKTLGQCSITAFLVQDIFGGKVYGVPLADGNFHCYNVVDGKRFDLTSEQFSYKLDYSDDHEQFRDKHFAKEEKRLRYEELKKRLHFYCANHS